MKKTLLITGGSGFLGRHLALQLKEQYNVILGARNNKNNDPDLVLLENYPEEYKSHIINAIYLPYCDDASFSQNMDPINTFPIIFNCIFGDNIALN